MRKGVIFKRFLFSWGLSLLSIFAFAQGQYVEQAKVFNVVDEMPEFNGAKIRLVDATTGETEMVEIEKGASGLFKYLGYTIQYPIEAAECGIQGRVICSFVVEKDGTISDIEVKKSVLLHLIKRRVVCSE